MAIIDSQVHVYEANTPKPPWHSVPNWPDHVTGVDRGVARDASRGSRNEEIAGRKTKTLKRRHKKKMSN